MDTEFRLVLSKRFSEKIVFDSIKVNYKSEVLENVQNKKTLLK
jgi:hypothetical protein